MDRVREAGRPVLVADEDPAGRRRLTAALRGGAGAPPVLEAADAREMLAKAPRAGLVVLDAQLGTGMADALSMLRERHPNLPVVVLSRRHDAELMHHALELGAASYSRKLVSAERLRQVVTAAACGHPVLEADLVRPSIQRYETLLQRACERDRAIIESLAAAVEAKDTVTSAHLHHVAELALQLAELVEPRLARSEDFVFGCVLHDVGKIGVPEDILNKPGPLDELEWQVMRLHPQTGERVIRPLGLAPTVQQIVLHHHERWDGLGYPAGLEGERIPLAARIFSVCDALEAMTAPRPYRQPLAADEAFREVLAEAGRQFDPAVVAVLERGVAAGEIELESSLRPRPASAAASG